MGMISRNLIRVMDENGFVFGVMLVKLSETFAELETGYRITLNSIEGSLLSYDDSTMSVSPITDRSVAFHGDTANDDIIWFVPSHSYPNEGYRGGAYLYLRSNPSMPYTISRCYYHQNVRRYGLMGCVLGLTSDDIYVIFDQITGPAYDRPNYGITFPTNTSFGYFIAEGQDVTFMLMDKTDSVYIASKLVSLAIPSDPYSRIDPSWIGGGIGDNDFSSSDDLDFPGDPGVSAVNTGFISLWAPTEQQMLDLSRYMWNVDITTIDFWKRLWADPMDIIYGLNIIPVDFRAAGRTIIGGTEHVIVGLVNTKVDMDYLVSQWIDVNCGTVDIPEAWGAYLDYDPYTKLEIYLPYCGYHPLRIDDFMSGSISLKYKIDLLSGACVAMVKATKPNDDEHNLNSVVYQFMGNCATQIPVTASQFADAVRSTMSLAASIGTMVATGVGGAAAVASKQGLSTVGKAQLASSMIGEGAATVENVMGIKPAIERSGAIGGAAGLLAIQKPYLILTRPRQAHPENQNKYTGFPSFMTRELGLCSGWTIVKEIHLEDIPCTSEEMIEIDNLLKEGVIL